jgi:hypothetical protein
LKGFQCKKWGGEALASLSEATEVAPTPPHNKKTVRRECPLALKEGDRITISSIARDYRVKWIGHRMVVLETEDRSSQFLTTLDNLQLYCAPQPKKTKGKPPAGLKN